MNPLTRRLLFLILALSSAALCGADLSTRRGFRFGADLATIAKQAALEPADAKVLHHRPAVIRELDRQNRPEPALADPPATDPAKSGVYCFFDGKLYRIGFSQDRYRIEAEIRSHFYDLVRYSFAVVLSSKDADELTGSEI